MYKSMSVPIFDYDNIVYEDGNKNRLDQLKSTKNRGLSVCCNIQVRIGTPGQFLFLAKID